MRRAPKVSTLVAGTLLLSLATALGCMDRFEEKRVSLPPGTTVSASLSNRLGTASSRSGDPFEAVTLAPVVSEGVEVLPVGTKLRGTVARVEPAGRMKGRAVLELAVQEVIDPKGVGHPFASQPMIFVGESPTRGDVEKIAGGGVAGAVIGGIAGGKKGAVVGGALGLGVGTAAALATKGKEVSLAPGHRLFVRLAGPTEVPLIAQYDRNGGR